MNNLIKNIKEALYLFCVQKPQLIPLLILSFAIPVVIILCLQTMGCSEFVSLLVGGIIFGIGHIMLEEL